VLHVLSHNCHSLETVKAAVQAVVDATDVTAKRLSHHHRNGDEQGN
jgi:hypothetical protein